MYSYDAKALVHYSILHMTQSHICQDITSRCSVDYCQEHDKISEVIHVLISDVFSFLQCFYKVQENRV